MGLVSLYRSSYHHPSHDRAISEPNPQNPFIIHAVITMKRCLLIWYNVYIVCKSFPFIPNACMHVVKHCYRDKCCSALFLVMTAAINYRRKASR